MFGLLDKIIKIFGSLIGNQIFEKIYFNKMSRTELDKVCASNNVSIEEIDVESYPDDNGDFLHIVTLLIKKNNVEIILCDDEGSIHF